MRIIQTLYLTGNPAHPLKESMGFMAAEFNWMSWALSCLQLKKFYDQVELYTNQAGYEILIRAMGLPYDKVHFLPEDLEYPRQLWAYPKLYTYSIQDKPFIHVDGDIFFWEKMNDNLLNQPLTAQNVEINAPYFAWIAQHLQHSGIKLPSPIAGQLMTETGLQAYNAGLIGGHDLAFLQNYATQALHFIEENANILAAQGRSEYNMLVEQVLFHALAQECNANVSCYLPDRVTDMTYPGFAEFSGVSYQTKFIHLMGAFKRNPLICEQLAMRLRNDHPVYSEKILKICQQAGIISLFHCNDSSDQDGTWARRRIQEQQNFKLTDLAFNHGVQMKKAVFKANTEIIFGERDGVKTFTVPSGLDSGDRHNYGDELDEMLLGYLIKGTTFLELVDLMSAHFEAEELVSGYADLVDLIRLRLKRCCDLNLVGVTC